jgi:hypothetical protein
MEEIAVKKIIENNGKVLLLLRQIPINQFVSKDGKVMSDKFNAWKSWLGSNHVLKTQTHFLFCEMIQEAEWEDVLPENSKNEQEDHS